MPEPINDLIQYFQSEALKKADGGFQSERIRRFIRDYYSKFKEEPRVVVYALYHAYVRISDEEVKESYFRGVVEKAWKTEIDESNIQWVHLNKQLPLRLRKRKV
jgi:hypothetical protein